MQHDQSFRFDVKFNISFSLPKVDEEEVRLALLSHVAENCCYGKGAAEDMKFTDLNHSSAFHVGHFILCF